MHDIFETECISKSPGMPLCQTVAGLGPLERAASQICLQVSPTDNIPSRKKDWGGKKRNQTDEWHIQGFFDQWLLFFFLFLSSSSASIKERTRQKADAAEGLGAGAFCKRGASGPCW